MNKPNLGHVTKLTSQTSELESQNFLGFVLAFRQALQLTEASKLTPELKLADLPYWDSIAMLSVMVMVETEYKSSLTLDDFVNIRTLDDLFRQVYLRRE
jgi:acyl carrier protein